MAVPDLNFGDLLEAVAESIPDRPAIITVITLLVGVSLISAQIDWRVTLRRQG